MVDWERAVRDDGPAAWRTACRLLGNRQDAQECVQDAFAEAIALSRAGACRAASRLVVARRDGGAMDRLRRKYRRHSVDPPGDFEAVADDLPQPPQQAENAELLAKLRGGAAHPSAAAIAGVCAALRGRVELSGDRRALGRVGWRGRDVDPACPWETEGIAER